MGDVCVEEERLDMNTFPNCSMEKAIWFHCYIVCIQSQWLWFSEYNFCRDSKENNKANTLESFYIQEKWIAPSQWVLLIRWVEREKKLFFFLTAGEMISSPKLNGERFSINVTIPHSNYLAKIYVNFIFSA